MLWSCTQSPEIVVALCQAHPDIVAVAIKRLHSEMPLAATQGEQQ
jgi:hypothetical protein